MNAPTLFPDALDRPGFIPETGQMIVWRHRRLGLCAGRVVGVWPTGITARRDGVNDRTKPHYLPYGRFWRSPVANSRREAAQ